MSTDSALPTFLLGLPPPKHPALNPVPGEKKRKLNGHTSYVYSVAFSPADPATLASASADNTVILWDTATGSIKHTLKGHTNSVRSVAFSPTDPATLASASNDNTVILWETASGKIKRTLKGHAHYVTSVAFSPTNHATLASASEDKTVILWDTATGNIKHTLKGHTRAVYSVAFSPTDPATLASACNGKTVILWDIASGQIQKPPATSTSSSSSSTPAVSELERNLHALRSELAHHKQLLQEKDSLLADKDQRLLNLANQNADLTQKVAALTSATASSLDQHSTIDTTFPVTFIELRLSHLEKLIAALSLSPLPSTATATVSGPPPPSLQDHLRIRDLLRSDVIEEWKGIERLMGALSAEAQSQLLQRSQHRIDSLKGALKLHQSVVDLYPLPAPASEAGSQRWPWQQARERIQIFKKELVAPLLTVRQKRRQMRENIQTNHSLGVEVDAQSLAELSHLNSKVDDLGREFQTAYDNLMSILRPGFPELSQMICQEIDKNCGMGKLRLDLMLSDFVLTPLASTPSVAEAVTAEAIQKAKGLKPKYMLKRFTSTQSDDFFREMEAMRLAESNGVHHPNVGEVEFGFEEGYGAATLYFLAMPLYRCDSTTWFKVQLQSKHGASVVRALLEMADGLNCLHHNGVIHGDIKPENVMFDVEGAAGRPKWIDFNFSGVDQKTNALLKVKTAALGFSLGFAPPEFFDGSTERRTAESDVYSLGMTFAAFLGFPDPTLAVAVSAPATSLGAPDLSLRSLALAALGDSVCDSLGKLFQVMAHPAAEKRMPLSTKSPTSPPSGSTSVLERLQEVFDQVNTSVAGK